MADHVRTQIRDAAVTLVTGLTTTASRVYASNVHQFGSGRLPALAVYTDADRIIGEWTSGTQGSRTYTREVDLVVEGHAAVTTNLDDTLDTISKEVEKALAGVTYSNLIHDLEPVEFEKELNGEGKNLVGVIRMTFRVITRTAEGTPDVGVA